MGAAYLCELLHTGLSFLHHAIHVVVDAVEDRALVNDQRGQVLEDGCQVLYRFSCGGHR